MYAESGGIFFCFSIQLNSYLLKDNMNPNIRVCIVLFIFYQARAPPECSPKLTKKGEDLGEIAQKDKNPKKCCHF